MRPTFVLLAWLLEAAADIDIHTKPGQFTMLTEYGYVYHPGGVNWLTFQVKDCGATRVRLYNDDSADFNYRVVIGGWGNTKSAIRSNRYTDNVYNYEASLVSCDDYRSFWIAWGDGDIVAGRGLVPHQDVLMSLIKPTESPVAFRYVSVGDLLHDAYWKIAHQGSFWNLVGDQQWMLLSGSMTGKTNKTAIWTDDAPHDIACARACHSRPPCVSFLYKGNEGKCESYSENFSMQP